MLSTSKFAWATALAVLSYSLVLRAQVASQWIVDFDGQAEDYKLERDGKDLGRVYPLEPLAPGDRIGVKRETGWLLIHLRQGDDQTICVPKRANRSCDLIPIFTVPTITESHTLSGQLVVWLGSQFRQWFRGTMEGDSAEAVSPRAGPEVSVPLLAVRTFVGAGRRRLCIAWQGGSPPYHVQLQTLAPGGSFFDVDVTTARLCRNDIHLAAGQGYTVTISSGAHSGVAGFFVVSPNDVPQAPEIGPDISRDLRDTLKAAWLASRPEWRWEAYLQLAPLCGGARATKDLCEALEEGRIPTPPPRL